MTEFDWALEFTLRWEGGYVNHPEDPGGETNFGISKRSYPDEDIAGMTRERASEIYHRDYWIPAGCDHMHSHIALVQFDCAVNSGVARATRFLQRELNVTVDGVVGMETLGALKSRWHSNLAYNVLMRRVRYLLSLNNTAEETFERGWMARTHSLARLI